MSPSTRAEACSVVFANLRDELAGQIEVVALAIVTNECLTSTPLKTEIALEPHYVSNWSARLHFALLSKII